jgi:hypothetical protein
MRTFLIALGALLSIPLAVLNWTSAIVGGIWLGTLGEWRLLAFGGLTMFCGVYLLSLVLMIGVGITLVGMKLSQTARVLGAPFYITAGLLNFAITVVATVIVFDTAINLHAHGNVWPYLLWSYAVATTPWMYMAQREVRADPKSGAVMWVSAVQFGAVGVAASVLVGNGDQSVFGMAIFFVPIALIGLLIGYVVASPNR